MNRTASRRSMMRCGQPPGEKFMKKLFRMLHFLIRVLLYNTMKQKRLTPSYCSLLGAVLLFAFSGIWHPLLHHTCVSHEKQELSAARHVSPQTVCAVCLGLLQSDEMPSFCLSLPCGKPLRNLDFPVRQCHSPIFREHSPRAPPVF